MLERLEKIGAKVLRTDELGTIVIRSDGNMMNGKGTYVKDGQNYSAVWKNDIPAKAIE